jgi:glutathione synthase/RimK-type ligase-like ATP-grasp enzyme
VKLAILSRAPRCYSTQRLKLAAIDRGHQCKVLDTLRFAIDLSGSEPDLQFRGKPLSDYDAVIPRVGASITYFGSAVVRQFEQMDVFTPNTPRTASRTPATSCAPSRFCRDTTSAYPRPRSSATARTCSRPSTGSAALPW